MQLLLIRHADSVRVGSDGVITDRQRKLSPIGLEKTRHAALALNRLGLRVSAVMTSPYPRAVQTVRILTEHLEFKPEVRRTELLAPGVDWSKIVKLLHRNIELPCIALCGHEPDLSEGATRWVGGSGRPSLLFHTGSVACMRLDLKTDPPEGTLQWLLDSNQLDMIANHSA